MVSVANVRDMARVPLGVRQARSLVGRFGPDAVLATGGYVCVPVGLAAWRARCPLIVHEQTVRLGLANRLLARAAARVAVSSASSLECLPRAVRPRAVVTGNPVRPEVLCGRAEAALAALGWGDAARLPVVYVTGGAQGSVQVNGLIADVLPWLLGRAHVIHQCGPAHTGEFQRRAAGLPAGLPGRYAVAGFLGAELADVLALADVLVSRAGAGTLAEITALGKASVLVPLASAAGDEQRHNAAYLAGQGAAAALLGEVTGAALRQALNSLLSDPVQREQVAGKARELGQPGAAGLLAGVMLAAARFSD
jgi:UDP-N-acetylglucosamine--N-acetylmuramyl-(pentapeptide) pyrophosphoryl-undecaprenol N-acetylglucosamine transferase